MYAVLYVPYIKIFCDVWQLWTVQNTDTKKNLIVLVENM